VFAAYPLTIPFHFKEHLAGSKFGIYSLYGSGTFGPRKSIVEIFEFQVD